MLLPALPAEHVVEVYGLTADVKTSHLDDFLMEVWPRCGGNAGMCTGVAHHISPCNSSKRVFMQRLGGHDLVVILCGGKVWKCGIKGHSWHMGTWSPGPLTLPFEVILPLKDREAVKKGGVGGGGGGHCSSSSGPLFLLLRLLQPPLQSQPLPTPLCSCCCFHYSQARCCH